MPGSIDVSTPSYPAPEVILKASKAFRDIYRKLCRARLGTLLIKQSLKPFRFLNRVLALVCKRLATAIITKEMTMVHEAGRPNHIRLRCMPGAEPAQQNFCVIQIADNC